MLVLGDAGLCLMRLGERGFHTILNKSVSNTLGSPGPGKNALTLVWSDFHGRLLILFITIVYPRGKIPAHPGWISGGSEARRVRCWLPRAGMLGCRARSRGNEVLIRAT